MKLRQWLDKSVITAERSPRFRAAVALAVLASAGIVVYSLTHLHQL